VGPDVMNIEPWLGALLGVATIGIGLVGALIIVMGRLVKVETLQATQRERYKEIGSAVFRDHEPRIRELEIRTGVPVTGNIRMHREDDEHRREADGT
jgi:hypothetical protein